MPFYDFKCIHCDFIEEKMLPRTEIDHEYVCPRCNNKMKRQLCNPEFKMKGAPPRNYQPLSKSQPKSNVRNINEIRRVEETK
jgi:putative FmdB family regulatory protein